MTHRDTTMLEKCVRAIADDVGPTRQDCERVVRAILNELKQVDEGMVEAARAAAPIGWSDKPDVEDIFTAMIDHVLSEGEG